MKRILLSVLFLGSSVLHAQTKPDCQKEFEAMKGADAAQARFQAAAPSTGSWWESAEAFVARFAASAPAFAPEEIPSPAQTRAALNARAAAAAATPPARPSGFRWSGSHSAFSPAYHR